MKKRISLKIYGRVQGVFFRDYAQKKAEELKLGGWVANCKDGGVELVAEGEKEKLEELYEWCYGGSPNSEVEKIDYKWFEFQDEFRDFQIRFI